MRLLSAGVATVHLCQHSDEDKGCADAAANVQVIFIFWLFILPHRFVKRSLSMLPEIVWIIVLALKFKFLVTIRH